MVGLTTSLAVRAGYEKSVGYAIPVDDTFLRAVKELKQGREVEYGFLGVAPGTGGSDIDYADRRQGDHGVRVVDVVRSTPAREAGFRADDVLTHLNGEPIWDSDSLIRLVSSYPADTRVHFTMQRGTPRTRRTFTKIVKLSKKEPAELPAVVTSGQRWWRGLRVDHATAVPGFKTRDYLGDIDPQGCVAIVAVQPDSPAEKAKLRAGMFVTHVNDQRVSHPDKFYQEAEEASGSVDIRCSVRPGDSSTFQVETEPY